MTMTVRITPQAHETLKALAEQSGETMQAVLDRLVAQEQESLFWQQTNAAYAALRADEAAWQEEIAERALWDTTLMDGLEDERSV
ncbi:MAG: toxin-antitoxin system protein [Thermomicrobiales bacterium]